MFQFKIEGIREFGIIISNTLLRPAFIFSIHKIISLRFFYFTKIYKSTTTGINKYIYKSSVYLFP